MSNRAHAAAKYTDAFCRSMLKCVQSQIEYDKNVHNQNDIGVMTMHEDDSTDYHDGTYFDDISGESLDHRLTRQSRQE